MNYITVPAVGTADSFARAVQHRPEIACELLVYFRQLAPAVELLLNRLKIEDGAVNDLKAVVSKAKTLLARYP